MTLRLGDTAPDFIQHSSAGEMSFHQCLGDSWGILCSHPADFPPVCTTDFDLTLRKALSQTSVWLFYVF